ncbi:hypothetical protein L484_013933 [Morus notabilis]|uniref:Uncharacterized protein n=1 Tax=Morus notabilis TaxID=981085 RepID=W9QRE4_9ROSA|nr:hypothetical protein L484_013933 [Morus notabilis]
MGPIARRRNKKITIVSVDKAIPKYLESSSWFNFLRIDIDNKAREATHQPNSITSIDVSIYRNSNGNNSVVLIVDWFLSPLLRARCRDLNIFINLSVTSTYSLTCRSRESSLSTEIMFDMPTPLGSERTLEV